MLSPAKEIHQVATHHARIIVLRESCQLDRVHYLLKGDEIKAGAEVRAPHKAVGAETHPGEAARMVSPADEGSHDGGSLTA